MDTTLDGLLNRQLILEQPKNGFRVAVDTVLLAAAVPVVGKQSVLDMGCGVGGAMLCLAFRAKDITAVGIDIQKDLIDLCHKNIVANHKETSLRTIEMSALRLPLAWEATFDHVMINPPYHDNKNHDISPNRVKRLANTENSGEFISWLHSAVRVLKPSGVLTLIHRADRLDELLSALDFYFSAIEILPIAPRNGATPKRIILRAYKNEMQNRKYCEPFILHQDDGIYTEAAEAILRYGQSLPFK